MAKRESVRLFESDFLERFSHVHPVMPLLIFGPIVSALVWLGSTGFSVGSGLLIYLSGLFIWTFTEYTLHRFLFHYEFKSKIGKRFHYIIHGNHHDIPDDPTRLVMPPVAALILASFFYGLFFVLVGPMVVNLFFGGFLSGYLAYDYTHYAVHHFRPRTRWGKWLKQLHMNHHFVNHEQWVGVSSPLWDYVFGTNRRPKKNPS